MEPSPDKEAVTKKMRALARLRRCHTTVEPAKQGRLLKVRTYCPSEPPPGQTLPDRQVQTDLTTIATPEGAHYLVEHTIRMPTLEHFQYFWDRPQFRMLGTEVFADTKEISESVAAYRAALDAMVGRNFGSASVVVVADGGTPRTAALFAVGTDAPKIHSIDPEMRREWLLSADEETLSAPEHLPTLLILPKYACRLQCHRLRVEDWIENTFGADAISPTGSKNEGGVSSSGTFGAQDADATLVVVAVHSHVKLDAYVPALRHKLDYPHTIVVTMPCCVDQSMEIKAPLASRSQAPGTPVTAAAASELPVANGLENATAAAGSDNVGAGWAQTVQESRRSNRAKKRRLMAPTREYHDYGVHSRERVIRVFNLEAGDDMGIEEPTAPGEL